ncbi:MAG TPA: ImmA/IrrE family metallo-endopeptidase [Ktedonobacteraceae bacterium]
MSQKASNLPLDAPHYATLRHLLRELATPDPELMNIEELSTFLHTQHETVGDLTLAEFKAAPDDVKRMMAHNMVLGASELADIHEVSRAWLRAHGYPLPPWDLSVPRVAVRMIPYKGKVGATVEWEPENRVNLNPQLNEQERRWVLAMAIGAGERPQWNDEEIKRYAAYLTMPEQAFQQNRHLSDEQLAEQYQVPIEAVQYRRTLPDVSHHEC